jgi:hypothetical protein
MGQWQPIETAPKDGTKILICGNNFEGVLIGYWWDHQTISNGKVTYSHQRWASHFIGLLEPDPKFWMPLPIPPKQGD